MTVANAFPTTSDNTEAAVILKTTQILALYNAQPGARPESTTIDDDVMAWTATTAKANGWHAVEFLGDVCVLKAVKPTRVGISTTVKPTKAPTQPSERAASGSNVLPLTKHDEYPASFIRP